MVWTLLAASEVTTASKQHRRSSLTSDLESVTPITYLTMCILLIWYGPFWQPPRSQQPPNSLRGQVWPQIWNQWPQLPTYPCAYCLYGMHPFGSLQGHYSLQTASEVKSDLIFQIGDLNYTCCFIYLTYNCLNFTNETRRMMIHWPACFAAGKNRGPSLKLIFQSLFIISQILI